MREQTEKEILLFFEKISKFIGKNVEALVNLNGEKHAFRFHNLKVYFMKEEIAQLCSSISPKLMISAGISLGKFTKTG
jgi:60S ribosome subunit biogenesis protein NIP7